MWLKNISGMPRTTLKSLTVKAKEKLPLSRRRQARWRVEVTDENTLGRILSMKIAGVWVVLAPIIVLAAVASLIVVILAFTPVGRILPGRLAPRERDLYADMAVRADSLEHLVSIMDKYTGNVRALLTDSLTASAPDSLLAQGTDSLAGASEAELRFVQQFEQRERFKLSVLSPLAADGMIFQSPFSPQPQGTAVSAVYRGTVVAAQWMPQGWWSVTVQHPNDFLSIYAPLTDVYVTKGARVVGGQRIGSGEAPTLELWHSGSELNPAEYIPDLN